MIENDQIKLVWDSTIVTDRRVPHNRPDITIVLKDRHQSLMVDVAVSNEQYIVTTEAIKIVKCFMMPTSCNRHVNADIYLQVPQNIYILDCCAESILHCSILTIFVLSLGSLRNDNGNSMLFGVKHSRRLPNEDVKVSVFRF